MDISIKTTKKNTFSCWCCYEEVDKISINEKTIEIESSKYMVGIRENISTSRILRSDINSVTYNTGHSFLLSWVTAFIVLTLFTIGAATEIWTIAYVGIMFIIPCFFTCFCSITGKSDMTDLKIVANKGITVLNIRLSRNDACVIADTLFPSYSDLIV
jgi:hypothetical protein